MDKFVRSLITEWRRLDLPFEKATFVLGVSGGADSVSLALALHELKNRKKLNLRFIFAHFNHSLRGRESDGDEEFVKELAERFGFELALKKERISGQGNLEQNARRARYDFLMKTAQNLKARAVLTAHTLNDQAETFLLNLIRGSGLEGLGGMRIVRSLKGGEPGSQSQIPNPKSQIELVRPLLSWARREMTEQYCLDRGVEYRYDTMNDDPVFRRVRIRKVLLPLLEDFNPRIIENLAETAFLLQEDFRALEYLAGLGVAGFEEHRHQNKSPELRLSELQDLFPAVRRMILRDWLKSLRGDLRRLETSHFEAIENLIFSPKSGKTIELPGGGSVEKGQGKLFYLNDKG